jgi:uncharacterized membrane protein
MTDMDKPNFWTYGTYRLEGSTFATALIHFYRAEITRANTARNRLDVTTNWAVVATGAALSFAFGQPDTHHSVILLILILNTLFLWIETRRYRYYELWSYRLRLMETDFFAAMLVPPYHPSPEWAQKLANSLLNPTYPISIHEAFGRRLRRNYIWIFLILVLAWFAKLSFYPAGVESIGMLIRRARVGIMPGEVTTALVVLFCLIMLVIGLTTMRLRNASGEIFGREAQDIDNLAREIAQDSKSQ